MHISVTFIQGDNKVLFAMQFKNDLASGATKYALCQVVLAAAKK